MPVRLSRLGIVPSKIRSTRSSATIPPPLCWREPEPEAVEERENLNLIEAMQFIREEY